MIFRVVLALTSVVAVRGLAIEASPEVPNQEVEEQMISPIVPSLVASSLALFQGRGKKGNQGMQMAVMMGGMMVALGLAALAALSGKAMAASMAALMLAAMSLLKKSSGGGHSSYDVISVPGGHHHRSLVDAEEYSKYNAGEVSHLSEVDDRVTSSI